MKRTLTHLADGRELLYFDRRDDADRGAVDERELPPRPAPSELRYDPLTEEWIAIAGHRQSRTFLPPADQCPLCPSAPGRLSEIPASSYDVVVFENRFPSFSTPPGTHDDPGGHAGAGAIGGTRPGLGRCEVVCFTSDHDSSFSALSPAQVELVMEAWIDRTAELAAVPGVEQVFCFENRGAEIGITLAHPHGQIYAYPYVTPRTKLTLRAAERHRERTGGNLFADVLAAEREAGVRVVAVNEHWTAFVPAAARWPFEVHVYPHRRVADLGGLDRAERAAFGPLYTGVLRRLDALFGVPMPYVAAWHQAPVNVGRDLSYAHLELFSIRRAPDKLKYLAGSESAMGAFVNDVPPEEAARLLRTVITD
ncbi:galactose-1-phosphate uridylyltransferase [Planomonospora parontospora]|uniref:galactose-1-phosphate uridylyltransferase n=1 Tax=Planomonospora parontospora TaxID=58119 RepID=UPI00166FCA8B|nr:galactose-1-phosphate uridylyltransferase [Planomonospora parontospora]GGL57571.1 galactose-1-phosphate uridylyltransferase [Planomonospora parontospora subsp. antibiotica]GII20076.1 galactose-1-phosphate uridylyltransferase [Planomonospora parontospora subsp. antibiotica]